MSIKIAIILVFTSFLTACSSAQKKPVAVVAKSFSVPQPPSILTTPEQKAEFVATHYWDNFDFRPDCETFLNKSDRYGETYKNTQT